MPNIPPVETRSEAFFSSVVNFCSDAIITKDLAGNITSWNRGAERVYGFTAAEVVGKPVNILFAPEREDEEPGILERIRRGEYIEHYETVRKRKDGTLIDISLTVSPIKDSRGQIIGASKVARDITELKRAEERSRVTLASIGDAVISTDATGRVVFMNPTAEQLTGWTAQAAQGQPLDSVFVIVNEQTRRSVESPVEVVLREGRVVGLANHTILIAKDGRETASMTARRRFGMAATPSPAWCSFFGMFRNDAMPSSPRSGWRRSSRARMTRSSARTSTGS